MSGLETAQESYSFSLDPVTFEVLKNAFRTIVDEMAEQIFRTCHSFVIYNRDFSSALCDAEGFTIAQGSYDPAAQGGTLQPTAQAIIAAFEGDINPGDIFMTNDPYVGGTHFSDVRLLDPIFHEGELIAFAQSSGHWADVGGVVPGSFDPTAREHFGEGLRIPPVRLWDGGRRLDDMINMIVSNMRVPAEALGDLSAQVEATRVAEREILRLVQKYGRDTVVTAFHEVQDYTEWIFRRRLAALPDGTWYSEDFIDKDPGAAEGLVPLRVRMEIAGDDVLYDFEGSHHVVASITNAAFGGSLAGVVATTKVFFPDLALNAGFYRPILVNLPEGTIVNATWPTAVTGFIIVYEKIMNALIEIWSRLVPERAMAATFDLEYLLVGGYDLRQADWPFFMWYDWMAGGWGGRNGRDGANALSPIFSVGLSCQSIEGQERLCPVVTTQHELIADSGGPGRFRGGLGVAKGGVLTDAESTIVSYLSDRERSVAWGIQGGLPSLPVGLTIDRADGSREYLGVTFAKVPLYPGDTLSRPSGGGGGYDDPLERDPAAVLEDVLDGYVTVRRAARDYGVVIRELDADVLEYELAEDETAQVRARIRAQRHGWLEEDPEDIAARFRSGELDGLDLVRRYGVILDWGTGALLPETTATYRSLLWL